MNKHLCSLCFLVVFSLHSVAQITLGSGDFPKSGKIYYLSTATPFTGMDATLTGANYSWDYSLLATTRNGARSDTFITVAQTASLYALYFVGGTHQSNHVIAGTDFSLGTFITVTNAFNFFNNTSASYNQTGFGANVNGVPTPVGFTPQDVIYKFPLNYGNKDTSNSAYVISIPNFIYYGVNKIRYNEVDGWGTLTTPYGTFNALRLKSTITEHDSTYLDSLKFGFGANRPMVIEYKWLGAGMGEPLLQINMSNGLVTQIAYLDSNRTAGMKTWQVSSYDMNVFPNPASKEVRVRYLLPVAASVRIELTDLKGSLITVEERQEQPGEQTFLLRIPDALPASSDYLVKLIVNGNAVVRPLVIMR